MESPSQEPKIPEVVEGIPSRSSEELALENENRLGYVQENIYTCVLTDLSQYLDEVFEFLGLSDEQFALEIYKTPDDIGTVEIAVAGEFMEALKASAKVEVLYDSISILQQDHATLRLSAQNVDYAQVAYDAEAKVLDELYLYSTSNEALSAVYRGLTERLYSGDYSRSVSTKPLPTSPLISGT